MSVSKKDRDAAMRIILEHNRENIRGHMIGSVYIDRRGLPDGAAGCNALDVLRSMGFVEYEKDKNGEIYNVYPTDIGIHYFEADEDAKQARSAIFRHEWKIALFSALVGALASEPLWYCIKLLWRLVCS